MKRSRGILVTGGGSFLGDNIAAALLAEGSQVTLLARAGEEDKLGPLAQQTRWSTADVWSPASLRGKARNHSAVIHTVGSLLADPSQGLSYDRLNFVSARNVANMCVSDGVERMLLVSSVGAPWISRAYIRSKRKAEDFLERAGLNVQVIRAPLLYLPGGRRPLFYRALSLFGAIPPFAWLYPGRVAPMPIDVFARGLARLALDDSPEAKIFTARDLRRLAGRTADGRRRTSPGAPPDTEDSSPFAAYEEDLPFGWTPADEQT